MKNVITLRATRSAAVTAFAAVALTFAPIGQAYPGDPFVPHPPGWCPGNDDPNTVGVLRTAGYCEGQTFPDGTRWNALRIGRLWLPRRCIVFNGSPSPPLAPPGGCGGAWNG